jgi:hypothetical protein
MDRVAKAALIVGLIVLAMHAPGAAQQERRGELPFQSRDCGKGSVEERLNCLNGEIIQLKRRLEGRDVRIMPLQR